MSNCRATFFPVCQKQRLRAAKLVSLEDTYILAFGVLGDVFVVHIFAEFFPVSNPLQGVVPRHVGVIVALNPQVTVICAGLGRREEYNRELRPETL